MKKLYTKISFMVFLIFFVSLSYSTGEAQPILSDIQATPSAGPIKTVYLITLRIKNTDASTNTIKNLYQLREKTERIPIPINDAGINGDKKKGDGVYTGKAFVPETAAKGMHIFQVFVKDSKGKLSNMLEYTFTVLELI